MKIIALSDTHGDLPNTEPCDVLIIAGDICPLWSKSKSLADHRKDAQRAWVRDRFLPWTEEQPAKRVLWIGGNHDFGVEMPGAYRSFEEKSPKWVKQLQDEAFEWDKHIFWGTPWCPNLFHWAFYKSDQQWEGVAQSIPTDVDVLILHSPPRDPMLVDMCGQHPDWASPYMYQQITQRIKPKLVICGHLHEGWGTKEIDGITFANVALKNDEYETVRKPMTFYIDKRGVTRAK